MPVQQLQISNPSNGVVVVTPDADRPKSYLRFEAKGDPSGEDVKIVSRDTAFQAPLVKAVKRGVLVVDDNISGDEELQRVLGAVQPREPVGNKPLTAVRVDYVYDEESNSYNKVDRDVRVVIDPLQKG
jgi:hypothetical protein